jgi:hypothetical protein
VLHRRDMQIWLQLSLLLIVVAANDLHYNTTPPAQDTAPFPAIATALPAAPVQEVIADKYDIVLRKNAALGLPFSDITEFSEQNSKQEAYIDWLKEHYESWLITYYYLAKCKKSVPEDYTLIVRSLEKELDAAHAAKTVENNILQAAAGSYREMYTDIPCDGTHIATTKPAYDANLQQMRAATSPTGGNAGAGQDSVTNGRH